MSTYVHTFPRNSFNFAERGGGLSYRHGRCVTRFSLQLVHSCGIYRDCDAPLTSYPVLGVLQPARPLEFLLAHRDPQQLRNHEKRVLSRARSVPCENRIQRRPSSGQADKYSFIKTKKKISVVRSESFVETRVCKLRCDSLIARAIFQRRKEGRGGWGVWVQRAKVKRT